VPRRILYYCQSLVGIGHLSASLRVIEQLLGHGAQVDLIQGGLDTNQAMVHPNFRRLVLPTLLHDSAGGGFVDPDADDGGDGGNAHADLGAVWAARAQAIDGFMLHPYDAVVLEFWPFGRRRFKAEIMAMLGAVRERRGPPPVFTSVRDVLIPRPLEKEQRMVASVRKHIHTVFVRGDPDVIRFDETFTLAPQIADRLVYTGCIAPPSAAHAAAPAHPSNAPRRNQVLVTQGGGNVGRELLHAAIGVAALMPGLHFVLAAGARATAGEIDALRARVTSANVDIRPFLSDFPEQLLTSALSINMGGDNTLLDVLAARTPSLAYPYQANPEQGIRIAAFAKKGLVHALSGDDLVPERLKQRIEHALAAPPTQHRVAMDGARVTSERILSILDASD
jgi:predicted glycosyltransferase